MKRIFTFLVLFVGHYLSTAQTVTWSTPVTVSSGGTYGNLHPRLTLNRAGDPMVLWGKNDTKAYFSRWNGTGFTTPLAVGNAGINVFAQSWAGPDIASFGDTVYVTMKRTPETMAMNHMYISRSTDGGMTFTDTIRIDNFDTSLSRFPIVTTTSTGNPLIVFMKFTSTFGNPEYVVTRSTDLGNTFSPEVLASGTTGDVCDCCPGAIISSGSKALVLFRNDLSNIRDMWAGVSNDGGITFTSTMAIDTTNWMIMSCPSSGPDGFIIGDTLYSIFMSSASGKALVYSGKASISAASASHVRMTGVFSGLNSQNYPRIANAGNAASAVWIQNTSSGKSLVYSYTNDISSGFSGYATVTGATGSGVANGDVAMTPGAIHAVWEDDNTGKVMYAKGTVTAPVGIQSVAAEKIDVFPNPASKELSVRLTGVEDISLCYLTDNMGRAHEVTPELKGGIATVSLKGIAKGGYYFVLIGNNGKKYYSKLIIE
jgi:hypothetical protein